MERKTHRHGSRKSRGRNDTVLHVTDDTKPRSRRKLSQTVDKAIEEWHLYDPYFVTQCQDNGYILKLRSAVHDEEMRVKILRQHGRAIALVGVYGKSQRHARERLLGYILAFVGNPLVHANTWYVHLSYSDKDDIGRKWPEPIKSDKYIRLYAAGVGKFDYHFCYKGKTREHDELGFSDAATHRETADQWKDGL